MLAAYRAGGPVEFCCPGHRGGAQTDSALVDLLGSGAFVHDVTQVPAIDDLLHPRGAIADAQRLAAELWGARDTHFLVNGTTSGIQAAFLAVCGAGDGVVIPRACHRAVVEGLILTGAVPTWVDCPIDPVLGCAVPPPSACVRALVEGARMVVTTRPTYHGDVADLPWRDADDDSGAVRLVDEAWGAHLGFHPDLPVSACRAGADVVVNSTHKTGGALSSGSMLHRCSDRVDAEALASAVRMLTTTSPYYGVIASLDGARRTLALQGETRFGAALTAARRVREGLAAIDGVDVAGPERAARFEGVAAFDETRLVFSAARRGWSGRALADALRARLRIEVELADARAVIAQVSGPVDAERIAPLPDAVAAIVDGGASPEAPFKGVLASVSPVVALSPREAWAAPHDRVPVERAVGRVAAEMVCPYPPGMAVVSFGERVTSEVADALRWLRTRSLRVQGCGDPTLQTLRVVR